MYKAFVQWVVGGIFVKRITVAVGTLFDIFLRRGTFLAICPEIVYVRHDNS